MVYDLADRRGYPHPDHFMSELSWSQFTDWIVYYKMLDDPDDEREIDLPASLALLERMKARRTNGQKNNLRVEHQDNVGCQGR